MERLRQEIDSHIDLMAGELSETSRFIYENPEVALKEKKAADRLCDVLKRNGFQVHRPVADMDTAFVASRWNKKEMPHVAYVAQYDALLNLGHACGHNLCATASLGAALGVAQILSKLEGKVSVIGTPSEEVLTSSGKLKMIDAGIFNDVDVTIAAHPHTGTYLSEKFLAINQITARFRGKSAHAGDIPYLGVNAFDGVQLTLIGLSFLRQQLRQDARVHWGEMDSKGPMNVIPDDASIKIGLRASDNAYTEEMTRKAVNCIKGAAMMTGCRPEYDIFKGYRSFKVNTHLVEEFRANLERFHVPEDPPPEFGRGGSTDMGNVSRVAPAIYPLFKITEGDPPHSSEFCEAAETKGDGSMPVEVIPPESCGWPDTALAIAVQSAGQCRWSVYKKTGICD